MKKSFAVMAVLALSACGESAPPPKPAPKAAPPVQQKAEPAPQAAPAAPVPAPAVQAPASANPNTQLAERVKKALEGASVQAAGVDVTASSGVVTLFGTVPTNEEKARAARVAAKVEGVKSVDNRIVVVRGS